MIGNQMAEQRETRLALAGVGAAALFSAALLFWVVGSTAVAAAFAATILAIAGLLMLARQTLSQGRQTVSDTDWALMRSAISHDGVAVAITDRKGRLVCTNDAYDLLFGPVATPPGLSIDPQGVTALTNAGRAAWRDGEARAPRLMQKGMPIDADIVRGGIAGDSLIWRFTTPGHSDHLPATVDALNGSWGERLGEAGLMIAYLDSDGRVRAANRPLTIRATGRADAPLIGREFVSLLVTDPAGRVHFRSEGTGGVPLRVLQIPASVEREGGAHIIALLDEDVSIGGTAGSDLSLQTLLSMLPLGLALADRDGRLLYMNRAFERAAHVAEGATPVFPGDLVIREDKAAVADAVRRFATGQATTGDIAIRLKDMADEPVALTLAGARGLGEAAVLLSLKDNSEEARLKREVAQATKMQAVGQLAGGLAHDFNNIITAIIGNCDLMLMRHTPGDSDYDDIQQIRLNSNRAASLTRQLLAFSRQQTLRPQVLQLPDMVSEVTNLLQRVLGETIRLETSHGRGLGMVRADPGQLEQVIINLAINARDAMPGGGTLTIKTFAVSADDARKLAIEIMPVAEYTALSVTDTGTGIDPEHLGKIFEPFFTTKEVGKGTGLGLSMVYGIVKQSGGFIFADSERGKGTRFTIYLPVHHAAPEPEEAGATPAKAAAKPAELWGNAAILLVEDEDMVRAVAERALVRHGYRVTAATNGEEGLAAIADAAEPFDLVVTDVMMPIMDGPTMARAAREKTPGLPILFMSGYAEEQARKQIDMDGVAFLPKPFAVKQLAEAVQAALAARG